MSGGGGHTTPVVRPRRISPTLTLAPLLILVAAIGALLSAAEILRAQRADEFVIDVAGRQRMLCKLHTENVLLVLRGLDADPGAPRREFLTTLTALRDGGRVTIGGAGGRVLEVPPAGSPSIRAELERGRALMTESAAVATALLDGTAEAPGDAALARLLDLDADMLASADTIVQELGALSAAKFQRLVRWAFAIGVLVAVLALILLWMLVRLNRLNRGLRDAFTERERSDARFRDLFENATDLIQSVTPDGRFAWVNPAWLRALGYDAASVPRLTVHDVIAPSCREHCEKIFERVVRGESVGRVDAVFRTRDGRELNVEGSVNCRFEDGRPIATRAIFRDVTERFETEAKLRTARDEAEAANRAKSQFLANMSHELRTPLNGILGYSYLLRQDATEAGHASYVEDLDRIHAAGTHLLGLINDILDIAKIEAGRMDLVTERFDVPALLREIGTHAATLAAQNGNTLSVDCPDDLGVVRGDAARLRQVLLHLLSNATKFTKDGAIGLGAAADGAEGIVFTIRDSGIGMTEDEQRSVFQEFEQADPSTTRRYGGTGLGLAIARRFADMMGATLGLESTPGHGSTFTLRLPRRLEGADATSADGPVPVAAAAAPKAAAAAASDTVLVIDDDSAARELLTRILERGGYRVVTCSSGAEGLRRARELRPLAITLDIMMPAMDGWAVLTALKSDPDLARIPVVVVTMVDDRAMGFAVGASEYLVKPVTGERLVGALERYRSDAPSGRVLVVDDDQSARLVLRHTLERAGWTVAEASNGRDALVEIARHRPVLVLLDLMMPGMSGFEVIDAMRRRPTDRTIPVVVVTARELSDDDRRQLSGSVASILRKGGEELEDIVRTVGTLVGRGGSERSDTQAEVSS